MKIFRNRDDCMRFMAIYLFSLSFAFYVFRKEGIPIIGFVVFASWIFPVILLKPVTTLLHKMGLHLKRRAR